MASPAYQKLKDTHALPSPAGVALELPRLVNDQKLTLEAIGKVVGVLPAKVPDQNRAKNIPRPSDN